MKFVKGFRKTKQDKPALPEGPRQLPEIQKEYGELINQVGQLQYQRFVLKQELDVNNAKLIQVNNEAAVRIALDKAAEAAKPVETQE